MPIPVVNISALKVVPVVIDDVEIRQDAFRDCLCDSDFIGLPVVLQIPGAGKKKDQFIHIGTTQACRVGRDDVFVDTALEMTPILEYEQKLVDGKPVVIPKRIIYQKE
jgi:hypothetical protein